MAHSKPASKSRDAIRTCIGTSRKLPKKDMVRFVRTADGKVVIDPGGKLPGRGANLCMEEGAFDLAVKKHAFKRALNLKNDPNKDELENLKQKFLEVIAEKKFRKGKKPVTIKVSKEQLEKLK